MKPTRLRFLGALLAVSISIGWSLARLVHHWTGQFTVVGWSMPVTMGILTVALLIWTLLAKPRLLRKPGHLPLAPLAAARTAALALAASRVGTLVAGIHAGLALALLPTWEVVNARDEVLIAAVAFMLSCAFAGIGWWLEVLCRIKGDPHDPSGLTSPKDKPSGSAARSPLV